jgi:uncharacterized phiE125 gp8 family phage protein
MNTQSIEIITAPSIDYTDMLTELKLHTRTNVSDTSEDTLHERHLKVATNLFELESCGYVVWHTKFRQWFPGWSYKPLSLYRGNVTAVTKVGYYNEDDEDTTLSAYDADTNTTGWRSDVTSTPSLVYLPEGTPPSMTTKRVRPLYVEYTAGHVDPSYLPDDIYLAILQAASHMYNNRESHTVDDYKVLPLGFDRIAINSRWGGL